MAELEAAKPKPKAIIWQLYDAFCQCRRDADEGKRIKVKVLEKAAFVLNYEQDKAVEIMQAADDHFLKLCAEKLKRMNKNGQ